MPHEPGHIEFDSDVSGVSTSDIGTTTTQPTSQFSPGEFDGPEPDLVYRVGDQFYILYQLPLERLGIDDEPHYIMYSGTGTIPEYEYKAQSISDEALKKILSVSFDSGGYEEIEDKTDVINQFYNRILRAAETRPWILEKETSGKNAGKYVLLSMFIEQLFEPNVQISVDEYKAESAYINQFTQRQLDYWSAITLGEDPANNAALRKLQQQSAVTLASTLRTYAPEGLSEDVVNFLYNKTLTGDYDPAYLAEQVRFLAAPEFASLVDPELKGLVGEVQLGTSQFDQQARQIVTKIMGLGFLNDLGEQEFKTIAQSLVDPNGARILEAQLQELWDAEHPNKKGQNYALASATPRKLANAITSGLDEHGEDQAFFNDLMEAENQREMQTMLRKYGLQKGDEKTIQDVQLSVGRSFKTGPVRRLMAK